MDIFIDSSILVEHIKGKEASLFTELSDIKNKCFINTIVFSEFIYYFIGFASNRSPMAARESRKIPKILKTFNPLKFISSLNILETDSNILDMSYSLMENYNLLPNDAIIVASCKFYEIPNLASYDTGLITVCNEEKIKFIDSIDKLAYS